jgi:hypothetical protein
MTRKLLKTAAIVVIALVPWSPLELPRRMAAVSVVAACTPGAFTGAVSGGEVFATAAFMATGFGLVGFLEGFTPATMEAITPATTDTALAI